MYAGDTDDKVPMYVYIETDGGWHEWTWTTAPYRKNWDMMYSPMGGPKAISSWMSIFSDPKYNWEANWQYFMQYGMNASYMNRAAPDCSDIQIAGNLFGPPISSTSAASPAETVYLTEVGQDGSEDNVGTSVVYGPGGWQANDVCTYGDWGGGDLWYSLVGNTDKNRAGFFRPRANGGVVSFLDGHAKLMKTGALAVGTDWNITQSTGSAIINDRSKYLWDLQ